MGESLYGIGPYGDGKYSYSPYVSAAGAFEIGVDLDGAASLYVQVAAAMEIPFDTAGLASFDIQAHGAMGIRMALDGAASLLAVGSADFGISVIMAGRLVRVSDMDGSFSLAFTFGNPVEATVGPRWNPITAENDWQSDAIPETIWTPISAPQVN